MKVQRKPARPTHASSRPNPRPALRPGEWSVVLIDSAALRKKARRDYEKALRDLDAAKAETERFHNEDKPGFSKWLHANFGAILTEIRELQTKLFAAQGLVSEVQQEFYYGRYHSISNAYKEVMYRRANAREFEQADAQPDPDEPEADPNFTPGNSEFAREDDDPLHGEREFWERLRNGMDDMRRALQTKQRTGGGNRLKELYRHLARRLHPDKAKDISPRKLEWWHQTQAAYETGNVEQLETILTLLEVEERGTKETSISLLAKLTGEFKRSLRSIKRQLSAFRKDIAWNFSKLTDCKVLFEQTRRMLHDERDEVLDGLRRYEAQIQQWQTTAERPRKRVRAARGWQDEEWF
ncbi:MAG TPA: J domain-containing protein [Verrucomicrobiae bacterium]|nr:J domain-containing protein [Verrucomicrobiae bacterium]